CRLYSLSAFTSALDAVIGLFLLPSLFFVFFFYCYAAPRDLHSFPTRRSSDLEREVFRSLPAVRRRARGHADGRRQHQPRRADRLDRKSTRLNSSHRTISYAVFCLKKKTI